MNQTSGLARAMGRLKPDSPRGEDGESDNPKASSSLRDGVQLIATAAALLGIALYTILYLGYYSFYMVFGITPSQAGIDKSEVLSRASLGLAVLAALFVLTLVPLVVAVWIIACMTTKSIQVPRDIVNVAMDWLRMRWMRTVIFSLLAGPALMFSLETDDEVTMGSEYFITVSLFGAAVVALILHLFPRGTNGAMGHAVCAGLILLLAIGIGLSGKMSLRAEKIMATGELSYMEQLLGTRLDYAEVTFLKSSKDIIAEDFNGLYLGEQGGVYSIFDCGRQRVIRVPVTQVRLVLGDPHLRWQVLTECRGARQPSS